MSKIRKKEKEDVWGGVAKSQRLRRNFESDSDLESPMAPIPPKKSKVRGQNREKRSNPSSVQVKSEAAASTKVEMKRGQQLLRRRFENKRDSKVRAQQEESEYGQEDGAEQSEEEYYSI